MIEFNGTYRYYWLFVCLGLLAAIICSLLLEIEGSKLLLFFTLLVFSVFIGINTKERCFRIVIDKRNCFVSVYTEKYFRKKIHRIDFNDFRWEYINEYYNKSSMDKKLFIYRGKILVTSFFRIDLGWRAKTVDAVVNEFSTIHPKIE